MADNLPKLGIASVTPTRAVGNQFRDVGVTPNAYGAGVAASLGGIATQAGQDANRARVMDAQFAAYSAEAQFGDTIDERVRAFQQDLKALKSDPDTDFPAAVAALRLKHREDLDKERAGVFGTLKDPLAQKMFNGRMRLQVQAAHRNMLVTGDAQIAEWDKTATQSRIDGYTRRAGNVTGDVAVDAANLSEQAGLAAKDLEDYNQRNAVPNDRHERIVSKMEVGMVNQVLKAYGSNYNAGLALLTSKIPGTEITVGYNPTKPEGESILSGAETADWINRFTGHKTEKVGANLGEQLYQESRESTEGFNLEARLTELYKSGQYEPAEIGKARQQYVAAVSEGERMSNMAVANTYDEAYKIVTKEYDGDLDKALRSGDDQFLGMWSALGPKQGNLRMALAREDKLDPAAYGPLGKVIDLSGTPGGLQRKYPTAAAFAAEFQGPTKHLWPQALQLYQADVKRDTSQDVHYQNYKVDTEIRIRNLTGWTSSKGPGGRGFWDEAPAETQAIRSWVVGMSEQAWADHVQARKETPGKVSDALWYRATLSEIMNEATRLKKTGAFKKGLVPDAIETPASATSIRVRPRPTRVIDGVPHEWDGSQWVKKGAQ